MQCRSECGWPDRSNTQWCLNRCCKWQNTRNRSAAARRRSNQLRMNRGLRWNLSIGLEKRCKLRRTRKPSRWRRCNGRRGRAPPRINSWRTKYSSWLFRSTRSRSCKCCCWPKRSGGPWPNCRSDRQSMPKARHRSRRSGSRPYRSARWPQTCPENKTNRRRTRYSKCDSTRRCIPCRNCRWNRRCSTPDIWSADRCARWRPGNWCCRDNCSRSACGRKRPRKWDRWRWCCRNRWCRCSRRISRQCPVSSSTGGTSWDGTRDRRFCCESHW